ncbi:hypothetical protein [Parasitella parasitica]|uniref:Protein OS-9 homolog n=1 Tax=Parasitella parasitica TaxID=35722 RepID=A0A0B7N949_9FUNG|nr:hypothetical protein [Parasitella parasitica]
MATAAKLLTIALTIGLVGSSLQLQFIQDDVLAFPRYKVEVTREKVSSTDLSAKHAEPPLSNTITMTSAFGQPFSCIIPDVQVEQERLEREKEEATQEETEQEVNRIIDRGLELLKPIGLNCIRFFTSYWAYEYCHNQYVRQFHVERSHDGKVEKEKETASFFLGRYPGLTKKSLANVDKKAVASTTQRDHYQAVKTELKKNGDQRYLVQKWGDGSTCDLTDKPRNIEVQYHCDLQGQDRVSSFVELSTCNYQIVISTPRLCEEMNLSQRHHIEPHKIKCRPIVSDQLIEQEQQQEQLEQEQLQQKQQQELQQQEEEQPLLAKHDSQQQTEANVDATVAKTSPTADKQLLEMISDLTEQINQLKLQMNSMPFDNMQADFSFFTLDNHGNVIPGADLAKLFSTAKQPKQQPEKKQITAQQQQKEPVIFYNPNVPLQFSQSLVGSLEKKAEQTAERVEARQVESLVRQRVAEELEKMKHMENKLNEKFYIQLSEENAEKDQLDAVATTQDIEELVKRIARDLFTDCIRSSAKKTPAKIKKCQDEVIACYKSLDCWKEVANFKEAVAEEQKKFVAAYQ